MKMIGTYSCWKFVITLMSLLHNSLIYYFNLGNNEIYSDSDYVKDPDYVVENISQDDSVSSSTALHQPGK